VNSNSKELLEIKKQKESIEALANLKLD
jgi:hypothetical protein